MGLLNDKGIPAKMEEFKASFYVNKQPIELNDLKTSIVSENSTEGV